jgi:hypothetical protein
MTFLAFGCAVSAEERTPLDAEESVAAEENALSACAGVGAPDPGTCSACSLNGVTNQWTQTCITIECLPVTRLCTAPVVSCGACTLQRFRPAFRQQCTRADGSSFWQSCLPPMKPLPPYEIAG